VFGKGCVRCLELTAKLAGVAVSTVLDSMAESVMTIEVNTAADVSRVLEVLHEFHDAFVKSLKLISRDTFETDAQGEHEAPTAARVSQVMTGGFDVEILFALYRCGHGAIPPDRVVRALFWNVRGFVVDLRVPIGVFLCWAVDRVHLTEVAPEARPDERCQFALDVVGSRWEPDVGWSPISLCAFCFERAEFGEIS
jgi:hypothetical protein